VVPIRRKTLLRDSLFRASPYIVTILAILSVVAYVLGLKTLKDKELIACSVMVAIIVAIAVFGVVLAAKDKNVEKIVKSIEEEAEKIYLVGFRLSRWLETNALLRFVKWYKVDGFCYAISALAMLALKNVKAEEIRLARGSSGRTKGKKRRHSWVEIKIPKAGWYVMDLSWTESQLIRRRDYLRHTHLKTKWTCSYDEFWALPYSQMLREAIEKQKTSYIFASLQAYGPCNNDSYGFGRFGEKSWPDGLPWNGHNMPPVKHVDEKKLVSSRVLRDFVKNPRRLQPKGHSQRTATWFWWKIEEAYKKQKASG